MTKLRNFRLTIYRLEEIEDIAGLPECLAELKKLTQVEYRKEHVPAVVGELAGIATDILLSVPVQITLTTIAIGQLLRQIVKLAKKAGKKLHIEKPIARLLMSSAAIEDEKSCYPQEEIDIKKIVMYGPMEAEPESGFARECEKTWDGGSTSVAHFMAFVFPRPRNRGRTIWYLFSAGGEVCASWATQTFSDRLPDFLNPNNVAD